MSDTLPPVPPGSTIRKNADGSWSYRDGPHSWRPMPAPLTAAPWVVLEPAAPAPTTGTAMTSPNPLSPTAQAVKSAAGEAFWDWDNAQPRDPQEIAAALIRRLVILHGKPTPGGSVILSGDDLLAIATELEGVNG